MKKILLITLSLSVVLWAHFTRDNTTNIVTDQSTGLQWQDDGSIAVTRVNWQNAIESCEVLSLDGGGWRLPNFNELFYLADRSKANFAIDSHFEYVSHSPYWTSTTSINLTTSAWTVEFVVGDDGYDDKSVSYRVRCVRNIP
jgi:hypothetical protein